MIDFKEFVDRFWEQGMCWFYMHTPPTTPNPSVSSHTTPRPTLHTMEHATDLYVKGNTLVPYLPDRNGPPDGGIETGARRYEAMWMFNCTSMLSAVYACTLSDV